MNKICVLEGVGEGTFYGKLSQNAVFPGKFHDNKIEILRMLLSEILLSFGRLLWFDPSSKLIMLCVDSGLC